MEAKTEKELSASRWWWRHCRFAEPPDPLNASAEYRPNDAEWRDWKDGMEQTAQEWELVRRYRRDSNWPPFYEIGEYVARNLRVRLVTRGKHWPKKITTEVSPAGWTDPDAEDWRWNLHCTRDALRRQYAMRFKPTEQEIAQLFTGSLTVDDLHGRLAQRRKESPSIAEFLRWIEAQTKSKGVELSRNLKGQRNKPISWTWLEVLDVAQCVATRNNPAGGKLRPEQRVMKTTATNAARKLSPQYTAALAEITTMPSFRKMHTPEHLEHFRKIILGRWTPKTNS